MTKNDDFFEKLSKKQRARTAATTTEEFSQSIQVPSSTHPGTTYPVTTIPHSDELCQGMGYPAVCRSEGLSLRDLLSLGAWRMGLGCSRKIIPPPPSSPSPKNNGVQNVRRFCTLLHIVPFYVFVTNGVHIRDGELPGTSYEAEFRYASIRFWEIQCQFQNVVTHAHRCSNIQ